MGSTVKKKDFRKKGAQKDTGRRGTAAEQRQARKKAASKTAGKKASSAGPARPSSQKAGKKVGKKVGKNTAKKAAGKAAATPAKKSRSKTKALHLDTADEVETLVDDLDVVEDSLLTIDDIDAVDDLLDPPPRTRALASGATSSKKRERRGPKTPTVPRTVKPTPKEADLELDGEVMAFIAAIDKYRHQHSRPFPTWAEIFYVFRELGYRR